MRVYWISIALLSLLAAGGCQARPAAPTPLARRVGTPARDPQDVIEEMRQSIERDVAAGFETPEQIEQSAIEMYSDERKPDLLRPDAQQFLREALAKHRAAQATWPAETDCDRLDKAFAELEQQGIVARQNFSDCGTCGVAEIGDEIKAAEKKGGRNVRGYVFYHMQDTESAAGGHGLYLNYGSIRSDTQASLKVAGEVVEALERHNLKTEWNGTIERRISVKLDWKRRRS